MTSGEKAILDAERIVKMQALLTGIRNGTVTAPTGLSDKHAIAYKAPVLR